MPDSTTDNERKDRSPLLPIRHPQRDFFVCDIFDAAPKSDQASMEHPLFTLATKPDMSPRRYEHGENWIELNPSYLGLATVFDRDVLIYCISQCMAALKEGRQVYRTMHFAAHDLLQATNRDTSDKGYKGFEAALERLRNTGIKTNIKMGGEEITRGFGFIDSYEVVRKGRNGRMQAVEITLSDWIFNAIDAKGKDLLTISPQYFQLRKPLERRLYELARKSCGTKNPKITYGLSKLLKKTGSLSPLKEFRRMVKVIVDTNDLERHIPDYDFELDGDTLVIRPQSGFSDIYRPKEDLFTASLVLRPDTYEKAREAAPGWDVYVLESEWREWIATKDKPNNPDAAFVAFCRKKGRHPQAA